MKLHLDLDFSSRERAIIACSLAAGFVVGMWFGITTVPAEALNVPKYYGDEYVRTAYNPVGTGHLLATFALPLVAVYYSYHTPFEDADGGAEE